MFSTLHNWQVLSLLPPAWALDANDLIPKDETEDENSVSPHEFAHHAFDAYSSSTPQGGHATLQNPEYGMYHVPSNYSTYPWAEQPSVKGHLHNMPEAARYQQTQNIEKFQQQQHQQQLQQPQQQHGGFNNPGQPQVQPLASGPPQVQPLVPAQIVTGTIVPPQTSTSGQSLQPLPGGSTAQAAGHPVNSFGGFGDAGDFAGWPSFSQTSATPQPATPSDTSGSFGSHAWSSTAPAQHSSSWSVPAPQSPQQSQRLVQAQSIPPNRPPQSTWSNETSFIPAPAPEMQHQQQHQQQQWQHHQQPQQQFQPQHHLR
eukprot:gnl/MRDRNA2_/MRDRNA2_77998_c1_seq2.p1 gnl/MRDRNA2_/MRDRNA2_77998_c1~~gnl/MRDRNA2_/MRDRNA2_77998_c1_seq2.p1  ORF type:complete len:314 (-),score=59.76 gnl/MRDRNA2_/MRDRNA2_77998_c1_seq2:122-1063(-)